MSGEKSSREKEDVLGLSHDAGADLASYVKAVIPDSAQAGTPGPVIGRVEVSQEEKNKKEEEEWPREQEAPETTTAPGQEAGAGHVTASVKSRSWLYEIPVFYFLLYVIQRSAFPELPGFTTVNPSPFWLGILLFGFRYGMTAGVAAGFVSGAFFTWGIKEGGDGYLLEDLDFYFRPGLFAIMGASIGAAADNFAQRINALDFRVLDLLEKIHGLTRHLQTEQQVLRSVEQQVVSQMSSIVTLFHGSRELGTLDRSELLPAMLKFFSAALKTKKSSLFTRKEGRWVLFDEMGWGEHETYARSVMPGEGLVGKAAAEKRVVSVKDIFVDEEDGALSPDTRLDAIMAAPILDPAGEPIAVFAVQAMEFMAFNTSSLNLLMLLAEWGGESVAKCAHVEDLKTQSVFDGLYGVHSAVYFDIQVGKEFGRCERYALPFSILLAGFAPSGLIPPDKQIAYHKLLSRGLREMICKTDAVTRTLLEYAPFAVLMSTSTREAAEGLKKKILTHFQNLDLPVPIRVGIGSYQFSMKTKEELIEQARSDLSG